MIISRRCSVILIVSAVQRRIKYIEDYFDLTGSEFGAKNAFAHFDYNSILQCSRFLLKANYYFIEIYIAGTI